jgi:hypothetical protein
VEVVLVVRTVPPSEVVLVVRLCLTVVLPLPAVMGVLPKFFHRGVPGVVPMVTLALLSAEAVLAAQGEAEFY